MDDVFATRLKALRLSYRFKLKDVGDSVGCSLKTIGNLENSRKSPSIAMALSLANFFGVSLDYLFGRTDVETPLDGIKGENNFLCGEIVDVNENKPRIEPEFELETFAARLKELRLARRLIQRNVGEAVGCHTKSINSLEKARRAPSIDVILALADFFGVSVDYLVGWTDDKPAANDGGSEAASPSPPPDEERKKLIGMIENMREENIEKAMSYIAFLGCGRQCGDKKI